MVQALVHELFVNVPNARVIKTSSGAGGGPSWCSDPIDASELNIIYQLK